MQCSKLSKFSRRDDRSAVAFNEGLHQISLQPDLVIGMFETFRPQDGQREFLCRKALAAKDIFLALAVRFSRPCSGYLRPYSPARTPTTEKPLISIMFTLTLWMRPEVKPTIRMRPPTATQRTLSSNTSPPTGS